MKEVCSHELHPVYPRFEISIERGGFRREKNIMFKSYVKFEHEGQKYITEVRNSSSIPDDGITDFYYYTFYRRFEEQVKRVMKTHLPQLPDTYKYIEKPNVHNLVDK